jgi:hypothetical protein
VVRTQFRRSSWKRTITAFAPGALRAGVAAASVWSSRALAGIGNGNGNGNGNVGIGNGNRNGNGNVGTGNGNGNGNAQDRLDRRQSGFHNSGTGIGFNGGTGISEPSTATAIIPDKRQRKHRLVQWKFQRRAD